MGIALLAHTGWGAYPVLARYLQTVSDLPSMALLGLDNLIALAVSLPFFWRHADKRTLRSTLIWGFALVVVLRAITNVLAARFTPAWHKKMDGPLEPTQNWERLVALLREMVTV